MLLVYYRLYITYTLVGFLFGLDQSNICRSIQKIVHLIKQWLPIPQKLYKITKRLKRLKKYTKDCTSDKTMVTNTTEIIQNNKKAKTSEEVEQYFPGFLSFIDCTEQQIPRQNNKRRKK